MIFGKQFVKINKVMRKLKIGLALGGGGVRGIAHLGVLKILEREKIMPDFIAGTSMGSIVGAMYCCGISIDEIEKKLIDFIGTDIYKNLKFESMPQVESKNFFKNILNKVKQKVYFYLSGVKMAFLEKSAVDSLITYFLPDIDFKDLKIPFASVSVDILQGKEIIMREGSIREAVASSISIPGIMPPAKFEEHILVDGGVVQMVPVKVLRDMGCDFSIGVNVSANLSPVTESELKNAFNIEKRASNIAISHLIQIQLKDVDFLLEPSVKDIKWFEFKRFRECILAGENETEGKIRRLKSKIRSKKFLTFIKRIF